MRTYIYLTFIQIKIVLRNRSGLFWTVLMPVLVYVAISLLPINRFLNSDVPYAHYLLPGVVAMTLMQTGIYTLAYWFIDFRARGVMKRFMATPLTKSQLIISVLVSRLFVMVLQAGMLTLLGKIIFHAPFSGNVISTIIVILIGGSMFLLIGLLISTAADTYESAAPITAAVGLPMTFLGNIFYPVSSLPHAFQVFSKFLPITPFAEALRNLYLHAFSFGEIWQPILIMLCWLVGLLLLVIWRFRLEE